MDNKTCKIVAIVGIVLASIFGIYLLGGVLYFFKSGVTNISDFLCWCCAGRNKRNDLGNQNYPQQPPMVVYQPVRGPQMDYERPERNVFYDESLSPTKSDVTEMEQSFDLEAQRNHWSKRKNRNKIVADDEIELEAYHPNIAKPVSYTTPVQSRRAVPSLPSAYQQIPDHEEPFYQDSNPFYQNTEYSNSNYRSPATTRTPYPQDEPGYSNFSRHGGY